MQYTHFTLEERIEIQECLKRSLRCQEIAWRVGKDPTAVSREIRRNRICDGVRHGYAKASLRCKHFDECSVEGLCGAYCCDHECRTCRRRDCTKSCPDYAEVVCPRIRRFPHVCNGCKKRSSCKLVRYRYDAKVAETKAGILASEPRQGVDLTGRQLAEIDALVTPLMKNGQSLNQIYLAHADELPCSLKSLYTYVNSGDVGPGRMHEIEAVRRKPRKRTKPKSGARVPRASLKGRRWADYQALDEDERDSRWEMDTVIGAKGQSRGKCLLTLLHRLTRFQLALLLRSCTEAEVRDKIDMLGSLPGSPFSPGSRTLVLTDNGPEFFDADGIEAGGRIRLFYCEAYSSWQKGAAERNHRYYRRILPKGTGFGGLDEAACALMMSHVNSTPRDVLGGISPIEAVLPLLGSDFLDALGIELVARDEVVLKPRLITGGEPDEDDGGCACAVPAAR